MSIKINVDNYLKLWYYKKTEVYMIKVLSDITNKGYCVQFAPDFEGMVEITYSIEGGEYIRHEHCSYPGSSISELNDAVLLSLNRFLNEITNGEPIKDGLAT